MPPGDLQTNNLVFLEPIQFVKCVPARKGMKEEIPAADRPFSLQQSQFGGGFPQIPGNGHSQAKRHPGSRPHLEPAGRTHYRAQSGKRSNAGF